MYQTAMHKMENLTAEFGFPIVVNKVKHLQSNE